MDNKIIVLLIAISSIILLSVIPSIPFTTGQFIFGATTTDVNTWDSGLLDGKVLVMDGNKIGFTDINGGSGVSFDANCPIGEVLRQVDSNGGYVCVVASAGSIDTNWETSWSVFDLNMKATYALIGSGYDGNIYSLGIIASDNNQFLIDLNGGGKSLFGFLDGNFTRNVFIDGNLTLNGVIKHSTCPSGYVLVPGDSNFGTNDFCVMKYEAQKSAIMQAVSVQGGIPWTDVSWYDAREACKRAGAHLITNAEWMTIARNISSQASNWQSGTVGSGCLFGGHMDNLPANKLATSADGTPYSGTLDASTDAVKCPFVVNVAGAKASRRTMNLSNGSVVWDISGNVWEWVDEQCANGSGMSSTYWYNSGAWVEWSHASLSDYELYVAGPTSGYTSANGTGQYYGCTTNGNGLLRGASWAYGVIAGAFTMNFNYATSFSYTTVGFRCVR